jgi:hypothetical protein
VGRVAELGSLGPLMHSVATQHKHSPNRRASLRNIVLALGATVVVYFGLYFATVRTVVVEAGKGMSGPVPEYHPFNGKFVRLVFEPAHRIDSSYLRRARWGWEKRTRDL